MNMGNVHVETLKSGRSENHLQGGGCHCNNNFIPRKKYYTSCNLTNLQRSHLLEHSSRSEGCWRNTGGEDVHNNNNDSIGRGGFDPDWEVGRHPLLEPCGRPRIARRESHSFNPVTKTLRGYEPFNPFKPMNYCSPFVDNSGSGGGLEVEWTPNFKCSDASSEIEIPVMPAVKQQATESDEEDNILFPPASQEELDDYDSSSPVSPSPEEISGAATPIAVYRSGTAYFPITNDPNKPTVLKDTAKGPVPASPSDHGLYKPKSVLSKAFLYDDFQEVPTLAHSSHHVPEDYSNKATGPLAKANAGSQAAQNSSGPSAADPKKGTGIPSAYKGEVPKPSDDAKARNREYPEITEPEKAPATSPPNKADTTVPEKQSRSGVTIVKPPGDVGGSSRPAKTVSVKDTTGVPARGDDSGFELHRPKSIISKAFLYDDFNEDGVVPVVSSSRSELAVKSEKTLNATRSPANTSKAERGRTPEKAQDGDSFIPKLVKRISSMFPLRSETKTAVPEAVEMFKNEPVDGTVSRLDSTQALFERPSDGDRMVLSPQSGTISPVINTGNDGLYTRAKPEDTRPQQERNTGTGPAPEKVRVSAPTGDAYDRRVQAGAEGSDYPGIKGASTIGTSNVAPAAEGGSKGIKTAAQQIPGGIDGTSKGMSPKRGPTGTATTAKGRNSPKGSGSYANKASRGQSGIVTVPKDLAAPPLSSSIPEAPRTELPKSETRTRKGNQQGPATSITSPKDTAEESQVNKLPGEDALKRDDGIIKNSASPASSGPLPAVKQMVGRSTETQGNAPDETTRQTTVPQTISEGEQTLWDKPEEGFTQTSRPDVLAPSTGNAKSPTSSSPANLNHAAAPSGPTKPGGTDTGSQPLLSQPPPDSQAPGQTSASPQKPAVANPASGTRTQNVTGVPVSSKADKPMQTEMNKGMVNTFPAYPDSAAPENSVATGRTVSPAAAEAPKLHESAATAIISDPLKAESLLQQPGSGGQQRFSWGPAEKNDSTAAGSGTTGEGGAGRAVDQAEPRIPVGSDTAKVRVSPPTIDSGFAGSKAGQEQAHSPSEAPQQRTTEPRISNQPDSIVGKPVERGSADPSKATAKTSHYAVEQEPTAMVAPNTLKTTTAEEPVDLGNEKAGVTSLPEASRPGVTQSKTYPTMTISWGTPTAERSRKTSQTGVPTGATVADTRRTTPSPYEQEKGQAAPKSDARAVKPEGTTIASGPARMDGITSPASAPPAPATAPLNNAPAATSIPARSTVSPTTAMPAAKANAGPATPESTQPSTWDAGKPSGSSGPLTSPTRTENPLTKEAEQQVDRASDAGTPAVTMKRQLNTPNDQQMPYQTILDHESGSYSNPLPANGMSTGTAGSVIPPTSVPVQAERPGISSLGPRNQQAPQGTDIRSEAGSFPRTLPPVGKGSRVHNLTGTDIDAAVTAASTAELDFLRSAVPSPTDLTLRRDDAPYVRKQDETRLGIGAPKFNETTPQQLPKLGANETPRVRSSTHQRTPIYLSNFDREVQAELLKNSGSRHTAPLDTATAIPGTHLPHKATVTPGAEGGLTEANKTIPTYNRVSLDNDAALDTFSRNANAEENAIPSGDSGSLRTQPLTTTRPAELDLNPLEQLRSTFPPYYSHQRLYVPSPPKTNLKKRISRTAGDNLPSQSNSQKRTSTAPPLGASSSGVPSGVKANGRFSPMNLSIHDDTGRDNLIGLPTFAEPRATNDSGPTEDISSYPKGDGGRVEEIFLNSATPSVLDHSGTAYASRIGSDVNLKGTESPGIYHTKRTVGPEEMLLREIPASPSSFAGDDSDGAPPSFKNWDEFLKHSSRLSSNGSLTDSGLPRTDTAGFPSMAGTMLGATDTPNLRIPGRDGDLAFQPKHDSSKNIPLPWKEVVEQEGQEGSWADSLRHWFPGGSVWLIFIGGIAIGYFAQRHYGDKCSVTERTTGDATSPAAMSPTEELAPSPPPTSPPPPPSAPELEPVPVIKVRSCGCPESMPHRPACRIRNVLKLRNFE